MHLSHISCSTKLTIARYKAVNFMGLRRVHHVNQVLSLQNYLYDTQRETLALKQCCDL
jgi:hypothetical protein